MVKGVREGRGPGKRRGEREGNERRRKGGGDGAKGGRQDISFSEQVRSAFKFGRNASSERPTLKLCSRTGRIQSFATNHSIR